MKLSRLAAYSMASVLSLTLLAATGCSEEEKTTVCQKSHAIRQGIDLIEATVKYMKEKKLTWQDSRTGETPFFFLDGELQKNRNVARFVREDGDYSWGVYFVDAFLKAAADEAANAAADLTHIENRCQRGPKSVKQPDGTIKVVDDPCATRADVTIEDMGHDEAIKLENELRWLNDSILGYTYYPDDLPTHDELLDAIDHLKSNGVATYLAMSCAMKDAFARLEAPARRAPKETPRLDKPVIDGGGSRHELARPGATAAI